MFGFPLKNYTPGICDRPLLQGRKNPPKHGPNSRIRDIWFQVDLDTYIYVYTHEVLPYIHTYHICIPISIHACKYTSFIIYSYTHYGQSHLSSHLIMTPPKSPTFRTLSKAIRETQRLEGSNARATLGSRDFEAGDSS